MNPQLIVGCAAFIAFGLVWMTTGVDPCTQIAMVAVGMRTFFVLAGQCIWESWDHMAKHWAEEYRESVDAARIFSRDPPKVVSFRRPVA